MGKIKDAIEEELVENDINDEEHREYNPKVFHPSQLSMLPECPRQAFNRKMKIEKQEASDLGVFHVGTLIHEWLEHHVSERLPDAMEFEKPVEGWYQETTSFGEVADLPDLEEKDTHSIKIEGRCDAFDPEEGIVYDFKTTGKTGWGGDDTRYPEGFLTDEDYHRDYRDQLQVYMACLGVKKAKIIYLHKLDLAVKEYPRGAEDATEVIEFDPERFREIMSEAVRVRNVVAQFVDETDEGHEFQLQRIMDEGHPFEKCSQDNCWNCKKYEKLQGGLS